ncbi:DUF3347 domain-containing protein [Psychroflexus halocasei]|uniref:DUF3347 domain-containing protein n=1 Tax=Psychroflexus halocasei TaxID=908615 RepID=A0A1H3VE39_9FLAO|nr:DUF3347 domain-containing protein [Psychroflexus halocasei]SDZ73009.1 Protein of unknown function [Psychroflexus halocasei]
MKRINFILNVLLIGSTLIACQNSGKKEEGAEKKIEKTEEKKTDNKESNISEADWARMDIDPILKDYMIVKDELVKDNLDGVGKNTEKLITDINNFNYDKVADEHKDFTKSIMSDAREAAMKIDSGKNLEQKRKNFYHLSEIMTKYVMTVGTSEPIYEQYCPMYDNDRGATWLSLNKEIRNPYFGSKMLKCGEVQNKF